MPKRLELKVDKEHMRVDRTTPEGEMFERLSRAAAEKADTPEGAFITRLLGFTEAAMVISETMSGKEAEAAMEALREEMAKDPTK